jgi:anti-anti-sigma regulatory factor
MTAFTVVRLGGAALVWADCPMGGALAPRLQESLDAIIRDGAYPIVVDLVRVRALDDGVIAVLAAAAMRLGQRGYGLDLRLVGGRRATVRSAAQLRLVLAQTYPSAA